MDILPIGLPTEWSVGGDVSGVLDLGVYEEGDKNPSVDRQQVHATLSFHSEPAGSMPANQVFSLAPYSKLDTWHTVEKASFFHAVGGVELYGTFLPIDERVVFVANRRQG